MLNLRDSVFSCCILKGVYFEKFLKAKTVYSGEEVDLSIDVFCQGPVTFTCQWCFRRDNRLRLGQLPIAPDDIGVYLRSRVPIAPDDPGYDGSQTTTLIINECQSKHNGDYTCIVTSAADNTPVYCETLLTVDHGMLSRIVY